MTTCAGSSNGIVFLTVKAPGYISDDKLATADIYDLMDELSRQFPWIGICVNKIDVTNVGRQHDLTELLKPAEDIVIDTSLLTVPDCPQQETE